MKTILLLTVLFSQAIASTGTNLPDRDPCSHDSAWNARFVQMVSQGNSCPGNVQSIDSLSFYLLQRYNQIYVGVNVMGNMPATANVSVKKALEDGFKSLKQAVRPNRLDSVKLVVDYVYARYTYSRHRNISSSNIDSIANLLAEGTLAGDCGNITHFLDLIITQLFPWWGTALELNSSSAKFLQSLPEKCRVSHAFLGLANVNGQIEYVLDATINGVWTDSLTGNPLSLDLAKTLLKDPKLCYRVIKRYSTFFGENSGIGDLPTPCVLGFQYPEQQLLNVEGRSVYARDTFWVITPWLPSQFDGSMQTSKARYYWRQLGYPSNNWANNLLIITQVGCSNMDVGSLAAQRYGFSINKLE